MCDTCAQSDKERLTSPLSLLKDRQCLVFTCRDDEVKAADALGYTVVEL